MILVNFLLLTLQGQNDEAKEREWQHVYENEGLRKPSLESKGRAFVRDVTVHSAVAPARIADVLVEDGDIAAIGKDLAAPEGALVIDGTGKHLAPGVIDTHSHIAIEGDVNEGTLSITADCDVTDVIDADDLAIYRALAGGVTTIQCLHGSANVIGGRSEVLKLRWHERADALRFQDAPQGIKFALGENPKRSNWNSDSGRFPATRMGVESVFERGFMRAREYANEWRTYEEALVRGGDPAPPRRDVRLDVLAGILAGDVRVHSHCYRADEILMLLRTAERFGFRIQTLQHVLEGYKVAHEIAEHGAGPSTFSDWWAYKIEAYDAIPQNAALLDEAGAVATLNSDSAEMMRHLYLEAGKSVRYAGLDPVRALALVTLNGARQLGVAGRTGSIEVGKDADLVLLDGDPLSIYSKIEWTMVDGEIEFQRRDAFGFDAQPIAPTTIGNGHAIEASYDPSRGDLIALVGATIHTAVGPEIPNGTLFFQAGRIVDLGPDLAIPAVARIVDATGKHLWPGMIALGTSIGLREIGSVRGTLDVAEGGGNQPDVRVTSALNAESAHIPVTRANGITRVQSAPQGGGPLMGQSAIIRLTGETWEELVMVDRDMLHLRFPSVANDEKEKKVPEAVEALKKFLAEAREYARLLDEAQTTGVAPPPFDSRLAALAPYARGARRVALYASNAQTILYAIRFAKEERLDAVLFGAIEAWKVIDAVRDSGLTVALGPVLSTPRSEFDPYDASYSCAAVLARAGVPFAIFPSGDENIRNLPFHAGMAGAFGLPREEALRATTLYPARILGLDTELGSLEPGKLADLVVSDGDLLEPATRVEEVWIDGVRQGLSNKQSELYERYQERLHRLQGR
jgi:imidazolonepropionase-like amidohydrolase